MASTTTLRWTPIAWGVALAFGPALSMAQVNAATGGPQVTAALNGVPMVNIVAPNSAGVSHNLYSRFNVSSNGLILNNATQPTVTQLAGAVLPNPNFHGNSASLILNEVVQSNPSALNGFVEVAGVPADVVLANPEGISCNGCGFINTPRVTLTTGTPNLGAAGALKFGVPVVSVTRGVLMKPQPLQEIPSGLASTTSAGTPATSTKPFNADGFDCTTSFKISDALLP